MIMFRFPSLPYSVFFSLGVCRLNGMLNCLRSVMHAGNVRRLPEKHYMEISNHYHYSFL